MIKLAADIVARKCDPLRDFLRHVGGDDFIMLFQSHDRRLRCEQIVAKFNVEARQLYDAEDIANGGIHGEDRHGNLAFFPVTTMSIGAVPASGVRRFTHHEDVASATATAKHQGQADEVRPVHPGAAGCRYRYDNSVPVVTE